MTFSQQLARLRRKHGMSQEQVGAVAGVSRQTVSKWELGETTPELEKLYLLCDYFQISMDELTGRTPPPEEGRTAEEGGRTAAAGQEPWQGDSGPTPPQAAPGWYWHWGWRPVYEYRSKRTLWGLPLVHINLGPGLRRAKGIIAVGTVAQGIVAVGCVSLGVVAVGCVSVGLITLACLTVGLLLSMGCSAVGGIALGGVAVGWFAVGGVALGEYAIGGYAQAARIAAGGFARGAVAIGDETVGAVEFSIHQFVPRQAFYQAVRGQFPRIWQWIVDLFYACLG